MKKILLVDDSRTVLMMLQAILGGSPYLIVTARDGEEGVAMAARERPDLIIMDVVMPKLDGVQARERLMQDEATRHIPIILATTKAELAHVEKRIGGSFEHVTKPFDADALLAKVRQCLGE